MSRRTLKPGDKVKLSAHGLQVKQKGIHKMGINWFRWKEAISRNEKDVYIVEDGRIRFDPTGNSNRLSRVRLGNLVQGGIFKFFKKKKGPLTGFIVKRDWVKFAK